MPSSRIDLPDPVSYNRGARQERSVRRRCRKCVSCHCNSRRRNVPDTVPFPCRWSGLLAPGHLTSPSSRATILRESWREQCDDGVDDSGSRERPVTIVDVLRPMAGVVYSCTIRALCGNLGTAYSISRPRFVWCHLDPPPNVPASARLWRANETVSGAHSIADISSAGP